jgi:serine/threonine protein kinase
MPSILGFTLLERLGGGTFGDVYKAVDSKGALVAIKILKEPGADAFRRFKREYNLLHHERDNRFVVDVYEASLDSDPPYLVMELCVFGSLRTWVETRQPWRTVALVLSHALQGLQGIHRGGGFHRDIKPDNLLRTRSKENPSQWIIKVADFGLVGGNLPTSATATFSPAGTQAYMAPEVLTHGGVTAQSDIYSLGITGIELLTGRREVSMLQAAECPATLKWLLGSMVSVNPAQRPNAGAIAAMLYTLVAPTAQPIAPPQVAPQRVTQPGPRPAQPPVQAPRRPVGPGPSPQRAAQPQGVANPNVAQQQRQAAAAVAAGAAGAAGLGIVGIGVLGLLAYMALGQDKDWDANVGRYRGSDGKFRR